MGKEFDMRNDKNLNKTIHEAKKKYSPPIFLVYGKLTQITAAGTSGVAEGGSNSKNKDADPTLP